MPAVGDAINSLDSLLHMAEQASHSSAQQNTGNGGNAGNPNGFDPNDPWRSLRNVKLDTEDIQALRKAVKNPNFSLQQSYQDTQYILQTGARQGIRVGGHALEQAQRRNISAQQITNIFQRTAGNTQVYNSGGSRAICYVV